MDSYQDPSVGAVAALYHSDISPEAIRFIERHDVAPRDAAGNVNVTVGDAVYVISGQPARFIEAQRRAREFAASGDDNYLFSTHRPGKVGIRHINKQLLVPGADLGIMIADGPIRKTQRDPVQSLQRYGMRVERLEWASPTKRASS